MRLVSGAVPVGTPRSDGGKVTNVHILTPETASTPHDVFASTRDFAVDDADYNEKTRQIRERTFQPRTNR